MIDEFQDTDPQQYRIFRRIWRQQPETALLLIGDPKQAIYAFRGADIFTYMKARGDVAAHYTLDTNWRSAPGWLKASIACSASAITPLCSARSLSCR
jgi:exodeoxyribonuclease V beta subunit